MIYIFNYRKIFIMSNIIKNKLLFINNFNILLFNYKQLIIVFKEIDDLIEYNYNKSYINKYQRNSYIGILIDIKYNQCKRHIEYFKFRKMIKIKSEPLFIN